MAFDLYATRMMKLCICPVILKTRMNSTGVTQVHALFFSSSDNIYYVRQMTE